MYYNNGEFRTCSFWCRPRSEGAISTQCMANASQGASNGANRMPPKPPENAPAMGSQMPSRAPSGPHTLLRPKLHLAASPPRVTHGITLRSQAISGGHETADNVSPGSQVPMMSPKPIASLSSALARHTEPVQPSGQISSAVHPVLAHRIPDSAKDSTNAAEIEEYVDSHQRHSDPLTTGISPHMSLEWIDAILDESFSMGSFASSPPIVAPKPRPVQPSQMPTRIVSSPVDLPSTASLKLLNNYRGPAEPEVHRDSAQSEPQIFVDSHVATEPRRRAQSLPGESLTMVLTPIQRPQPPDDVPEIQVDDVPVVPERTHVTKLVDSSDVCRRNRRRKPTAFARDSLADMEKLMLQDLRVATPSPPPVVTAPASPVPPATAKRNLPPDLLATLKNKLSQETPPSEFLHPDMPPADAAVKIPLQSPTMSPTSDEASDAPPGDWMATQSGWVRQLQGGGFGLRHKGKKRHGKRRSPTAHVRPPSPPVSQSGDQLASEWEMIYGKQGSELGLGFSTFSGEDDLRSRAPRVRFQPEVMEIEPSTSYIEWMQSGTERNTKVKWGAGARRLLYLLGRRRPLEHQQESSSVAESDLVNLADDREDRTQLSSPRIRRRLSPGKDKG
eukprot:Gregarina_sp_Poly_1__10518@NODE_773_length_6343_cov_143_248247_g568_i0_p1_GENE_NODE_773_length_6343_cov_143_248247_g568_i0NODE_773_length_6343_cov_143_248247_g568_i0_p1_ORF_typecomplete_len616_score95_97_NODE_773_length_6343_cov_143_248247_g568_i021183965